MSYTNYIWILVFSWVLFSLLSAIVRNYQFKKLGATYHIPSYSGLNFYNLLGFGGMRMIRRLRGVVDNRNVEIRDEMASFPWLSFWWLYSPSIFSNRVSVITVDNVEIFRKTSFMSFASYRSLYRTLALAFIDKIDPH